MSAQINQTSKPEVSDNARGTIVAGAIITALFFGGLGTWAAIAPLDSAVVASGTVSVEDNRKTVKHHGGGIVAALNVSEGDRVEAGAVLLRLDDTEARSLVERYRAQYWSLIAERARLRTEQANHETISFPAEIEQAAMRDPRLANLMADQVSLSEKRRDALNSRIAVLSQKINQLKSQKAVLAARQHANRKLLNSTRADLAAVQRLVGKGYATRKSLRDTERRGAYTEGQVNETTAEIQKTQETIAATRLEIAQLIAERTAEVAEMLQRTEDRLAEVKPMLRSAEKTLAHTVVRAPVSGTVLGLLTNTVGGVVQHGERMLDIVPVDEPLIITARIQPQDIDEMREGMAAQIRLTAYEQINAPRIDGTVRHVSADAMSDLQQEIPFFVAHIEVDRADLLANASIRLHPGMPAEVIIPTSARTALDYLLSPITTRFETAFRER